MSLGFVTAMTDFESFVRGRSAALLRTAYLLVGDLGHAEDLLQDVLTKPGSTAWLSSRVILAGL